VLINLEGYKMTLEFIVDTIDAVPEASRKFYSEVDGKFHLDEELANNIKGLKSALDKEKISAKTKEKELTEFKTQYAGIDPVKIRELQARFENNEEAQLIAAGKIDEVINKRTEKWRIEEDRQKEELKAKIAAAEAKADAFKDRVLEDSLRSAAINAGLHKLGIRDSLLLAKTIFTLDENGNAVQKNSDGSVVIGRDGKTPFSATEWYESQKVDSPHWYTVTSSGSSATGSAGSGGGKQMKRASFDSLSPIDKVSAIKNGVRVVD